MLEFYDVTRGFVVGSRVEKADTFWGRFWGLMGRRSLSPGHGLWLVPGAAIHTFFMAFPIDAVFLDPQLKVLAVQTLRPWRMSPWVGGAATVLELPAGAASEVKSGDVLEIREAKHA